MPVNLGVNVQRAAKAADFGQALQTAVNTAGAQSAKNTLSQLQSYIHRPDGGVRAGSIRIVNTTNADDLTFRYKSGGWSQPHRKERTAQALVALLNTAGVNGAQEMVDAMFRAPNGAYRKVEARDLDRLFKDARVQQVLDPQSSAPGQGAPGQAVPGRGSLIQPSVAQGQVKAQAQAQVQSQNAPHLPLQSSAAPVQVATQLSPAQKMQQYRAAFDQAKMGLAQQLFGPGAAKLSEPGYNGFFEQMMIQSGNRAEFRDLSSSPLFLAPGAVLDALDFEDFDRAHPQAVRPAFQHPTHAFVQVADVDGPQALQFRCIDLNQIPHDLQDKPLRVWATVTEKAAQGAHAQLKANALAQVQVRQQQAAAVQAQGRAEAALRPPAQEVQNTDSDASDVDPNASVQDSQAARAQARLAQALGSTGRVINALEDQLPTFAIDGGKVGQGGFGAVFPARFQGQPTMVKLLVDSKKGQVEPQAIDGSRVGSPNKAKMSEAYAVYLDRSRDPQWVKPNVITPSHFLVVHNEPTGVRYEAIPADQMKQRSRAAADRGGLKCVGLIMPRAPGVGLFDTLNKGALPDADFRRLARSGLDIAKALNARGWVHRDLKLENINFDGTHAQVFDTGMGFKFHKTKLEKAQALGGPLPVNKRRMEADRENQFFRGYQGGTPGYVHPRALTTERLGTQTDLHAWGLVFMAAAYPHLNAGTLRHAGATQEEKIAIHVNDLDRRLDLLIANAHPDVQAQATEFKALRNVPGTKAHFIDQCLQMADNIEPNVWVNRGDSGAKLQELLNHPAIQGP